MESDFFEFLFNRKPNLTKNSSEDPRIRALEEALASDEPGNPGSPWKFRREFNKTMPEDELI